MYEPDEARDESEERPAVDWDAWEKNRFTGWNRWWMILMISILVVTTIGFLKSGGTGLP